MLFFLTLLFVATHFDVAQSQCGGILDASTPGNKRVETIPVNTICVWYIPYQAPRVSMQFLGRFGRAGRTFVVKGLSEGRSGLFQQFGLNTNGINFDTQESVLTIHTAPGIVSTTIGFNYGQVQTRQTGRVSTADCGGIINQVSGKIELQLSGLQSKWCTWIFPKSNDKWTLSFDEYPVSATTFGAAVALQPNAAAYTLFGSNAPNAEFESTETIALIYKVTDGDAAGSLIVSYINGEPVIPPTEAPVIPPTEAPVNPETEVPINPTTEAPVIPPTEAPVNPETEEPVNPITEVPVNPDTAEPINPTTEAPVNPDTEAPINPTTEAPVNPDTEEPINPTTEAPVNPETDAPIKPTTEAPVNPDTEAPNPQTTSTAYTQTMDTSLASTVMGICLVMFYSYF